MTFETQKTATNVHFELGKHVLVDGFPLVFDLESSRGSWVVDARDGERYLDLFTFFASLPLGFGHPAFENEAVRETLLQAAIHKPSNSDAYTEAYASFVRTFSEIALPDAFEHLFFIEGGALAVENAIKVAFDWKARKNIAGGRQRDDGTIPGTRVLHFREAFHGRTGYTLSLTNTDPVKTDYFPKFDWPRVANPKARFPVDAREIERVEAAEQETLTAIEEAFRQHPHDIAAIIIEPIQGEGGDNHFRPAFFAKLREIANTEEALLVFDEVQTGFGLTGKFWAYEHFGMTPDIVCFGKKAQVCGIMCTRRIDDIDDNVFKVSSRINSTWGGNLVDMARCEVILKTILDENLVEHARTIGKHLLAGLQAIAGDYPELVTNVRGRGLMCAFDLPSGDVVGEFIRRSLELRMIILPCGERSVRFRPALTVKVEDIDHGLKIIREVLSKC